MIHAPGVGCRKVGRWTGIVSKVDGPPLPLPPSLLSLHIGGRRSLHSLTPPPKCSPPGQSEERELVPTLLQWSHILVPFVSNNPVRAESRQPGQGKRSRHEVHSFRRVALTSDSPVQERQRTEDRGPSPTPWPICTACSVDRIVAGN
jgi:hypothetical protein